MALLQLVVEDTAAGIEVVETEFSHDYACYRDGSRCFWSVALQVRL